MEQRSRKRVLASYRRVWEAKVPWVKGVNDDPHKAFCSVCCRTFSIGYGGYNDLTRHEKTSMHRDLSKEANVAGTGTSIVTSTSEMTRQDHCKKMRLDRTREETTKNVLGRSTAGEIVSALPIDLSSSLRMWVPPLRLLSASIWQVVQQRQVQSYYKVEEFVSVVLELVPDLLSTEEKIELLIGLRTKFALDSCHHAPFIRVKMLSHLDRVSRIAEIASSDGTVDAAIKEFKELIQGLLKSPAYRRRFFQEIYPLRYGPSYDAALQLLVWEFLSRLEVLLPVPSFHQAASLFDEDPLLLEEFLQMGDDLQPIQELLLHKEHFTCLLSAPREPQSSQNRPDMFGVSIDEDYSADVKEEVPDVMESNGLPSSPYIVVNWRGDDDDDDDVDDDGDEGDSQQDSDEGANNASQHDQQGDTEHSSQTSNGLSSSQYTVVNWRGDDDDDNDDDDDVDDGDDENCCADVKEEDPDPQRDSDEGANNGSQHDQPGDTQQSSQTSNGESSSPYIVVDWRGDDGVDDDDDDDDDGEGDSQPDSDEGASDTSHHDQQGDMQRTSQRTLNEERQNEIDGCINTGERTVKIENEGNDPPSTAASIVIPDNNDIGLSLPSKHDKISLKVDLEKNTNDHTKEDHVASKMYVNGPPHSCSICGKTYTRKHDLKRHHAIHRGEKVSLKVSLKVDLEKNTNVLTKDSRVSSKVSANGPSHPCSLCGKTYSRKHDLERHHRIHTGEKPYVCSHCGQRFREKKALTKHTSTHTGEWPFECSSCGKKFIRHSQLVNHLKLHTDVDKPLNSHTEENHVATNADPNNKIADEPLYPCSKCGTNFSRNDLMIHQATNADCRIDCDRMVNNSSEENESPSTKGPWPSTQQATLQKVPANANKRPHACPHCDKTFRQKAGLAIHISIHTGNRPFECSSCRKKFFRDSALVDHLIRHTDCMTDCERMINNQSQDKRNPSTERSQLCRLQSILRKAHKAPKYPCSSCGKVFLRPSGLAEHQKIHTGEKPYVCSHCGERFRKKDSLTRHASTHTGERPFECSSCGKKFIRHSELVHHLKLHTDYRIDCERMVNDRSEESEPPSTENSRPSTQQATLQKLPAHSNKQAAKSPQKYPCSECDKVFTSSYHLRSHQTLHTGLRPHACPHCGKTFRHKSGLAKHITIHTGNRPFECPSCRKKFTQDSALVDHLIRHINCMTDCERMINDRSEDKYPPSTEPSQLSRLQSILRKAHKAPKYPCSTCGKVFLRPYVLAAHQKIHTGEKPYPCSYCGRKFRTKGILQLHIRTHTGYRPHKCSVCEKSFSQQSQLIGHTRIHTGEKPYLCSFCGKTFNHVGGLNSHMTTHTGERSHRCEFCNKTFSNSGTLNIHRRVHTKERPFLCTLCPKRFPSTSGLKKHMRTHTGEKPFTCLKCGKTFTQSFNMKVHQRVHR